MAEGDSADAPSEEADASVNDLLPGIINALDTRTSS
jgi:hypothetical protein